MKRSDLAIPSPCSQDWNTMTAEGKKRFCQACKKHVQDLSQMSEAEAQALLATPPAEGLCVRYLYDAFGNVLFDLVDTRIVPASRLVRARNALAKGAVMAGLAASVTACMGAAQPRPPEAVMGGMVPSEPLPAPVATQAPTAPAAPVATQAPTAPAAPLPVAK
jgi:tRNA-binding EMAP/Myf-like protein